jgi:gentisate 1,2-dioxygenase
MVSTPNITLDELPELYQDLERQHLVLLWEIAPRLLPREPQPQAIPTSGTRSFDEVALESINPHTGGPVLSTMACWSQLIRSGVHTKAHRQTNRAVYHVFQGEGYTIINCERFVWKPGDLFLVPPRAWHEHANDSHADAVLFSVQDTPILRTRGLYREQAYEADDGHQPITREFCP